ncbi:MAG TPA: FAD-binding protein [Clostridiaceae bacterium]|nr:FAD-binding protein [Clostridiaceae bacterium]
MSLKVEYECTTDILIIGGGAAGIKAAIKAVESGAEVLIVSKFPFGRTGATFYPGTPGWGMNAIIFEGDSADYYYEEILEAGAGAANRSLARILADECTARFHELEDYGLEFSKDPLTGEYNGVIPCFGKRKRGSSTYGMDKIRNVMWTQLKKLNVSVRTGINIISLVMDGETCVGAVGFDELSHVVFFRSKAVILCTGGGCGIYKYGLATPDQTGDGYMLALDAGARLTNLEFIQFIPGLTWPVKKLLFQEKNLDTIPTFTNRNGEDILKKYLPSNISVEHCLIERAKHGPFSNATISRYLDIAMYEEWLKGLAFDSGGIHVHYSPKVLEDKRWVITAWLNWMNERGVDPVGQGFDMIPHAQCFNGGIYITEDAGTGVPGLYAAGETAGGPHGADRLGGAAIAATQVFGARAGLYAAKYAAGRTHSQLSIKDAEASVYDRYQKKGGGIVDIKKAFEEIREIMWRNGAIVRNEVRCREGLAQISRIESAFNPMAHFEKGCQIRNVSELCSYIELGKCILQLIAYRKESRGPHYRDDYPEMNDAYRGMATIYKKEGEIKIDFIRADY